MSTTTLSPADATETGSEPLGINSQTVTTIGTLYIAYAMSMVLRMIPTVAGTSIRGDSALGIDLEQWGKILATGTCGAMTGKFLCGWAADRFGGKRTFTAGLLVASVAVGLFAASSSMVMFQAAFFLTLMAQSAGWPAMTRIVNNWIPPRSYGRAWGVLSTSSRVGTLTATFLLGSLLSFISWREMLWLASFAGIVITCLYATFMQERPSLPGTLDTPPSATKDHSPRLDAAISHPFDSLTLVQALPKFAGSLRFWLISASLMGLTILWDFLLLVPMYLQDTLQLDITSASRAASAFPMGSLISVLAGGFVFDRLPRRTMAWVMAGLLGAATGCLLLLTLLPLWQPGESAAMMAALAVLFVLGLCLSPCYYIPASVFSIDFGGRHSGFLVAILDAIGFAATAAFYYFGGGVAETYGWNSFLLLLTAISIWSLVATFLFMRREAGGRNRVS